jgi:hypothetical protein
VKHLGNKKTYTVDITPSWCGLVPYLIAMIRDGNEKAYLEAKENLQRMAYAADLTVQQVKDAEKQSKLEVD